MKYHRRKHVLSYFAKARTILYVVFSLGFLVFLTYAAFPQLLSRGFRQPTYEPANILVITSQPLEKLDKPWKNIAQGGESHDWRLAPVADKVRAIDPEYIRIDHIYDFYDIVTGSPGNLQFNWTKFDVILDDIAAAGATPYIALSYMPPAIATGDIVSAPHSYADWEYVVQRTIEHVSGTRNTPNVYYEVWNEPDLFGDWKYYGSKNYMDLYFSSARGAQKAQVRQEFKIGGPATTGLYRNWMQALAQAAANGTTRLDFLSWHRYSRDVEQFRHDMSTVRSWLQNYPSVVNNIEYHITEWGHDSENDAGYDGNYGAAHTVATALEMEGVVDRAFAFQIQDGKDPNGQAHWGRWGVLTHQDHGSSPKPRYWALQFLNKIDGTRLKLLGKGTHVKALAARDAGGTITVLLANFDPSGRNREVVPVTFRDLPTGQHLITIQRAGLAAEKTVFNITAGQDAQVTIDLPAQTYGSVTVEAY